MHYVPESAREFLPDEPTGRAGDPDSSAAFHYQSTPIYLLTLAVALLLAGDFLLGWIDAPAWNAWREPFGYRLALWAALLGGIRVFYQTVEGLLEGRIGADLAITIAVFAAILLKEYETAALVVFIALCGESIEGYTVDRAQRAIRRIFSLCPQTARVMREQRETEVAIDQVQIGENVFVRPGERIPVDGTVSQGASAVDQSALTGESLPVDKVPGSAVFAGTLNHNGFLTLRADGIGAETTFARVVQLVSEASARKTPLERTADRLARLFLPVVLAAAGLTLVGWRIVSGEWAAGFSPALGVLVVACPCPLILATPTAVMAAMAWLAKHGVVVKGSAALERLAGVDTFAFDKTGTLTGGMFQLAETHLAAAPSENELLRIAAVAERHSEHPLAKVLVREAERRLAVLGEVLRLTALPGTGVVAEMRQTQLGDWFAPEADPDAATRILVGNRRLMEEHHVAWDDALRARADEMEAAGQTVLFVAADDKPLGLIGVRDTVREVSRQTLSNLRQSGIERFALLTGDRAVVADSVAAELGGVDPVLSELLPADKAAWIEEQTTTGRRVAMVGDGINDAPALATATVGIALGGVGSDIAAEAGDLVLMGDPLRPLPGLLRLSREMVRNIRQSIWLFAFGMNALGVLLCASGVFSPVAGAVFHEFASLAVMINAMRLLWFEGFETTRLGRWVSSFDRFAEALTRWCSPRTWIYKLVDARALLFRLSLAVVAVWWLTSGVVLIRQEERALVTRFGKLHAELGPGWHWRWPGPFERILRAPAARLQAVEIGFRRTAGDGETSGTAPATIEWMTEHGGEIEPRPQETFVLTGDEVAIELTAEVQFRIGDLKSYLLDHANPVESLRAVSESVLREQAARHAVDELLVDRRREIEAACLRQIRSRSESLGIDVVDLTLLDIHPPRAVVPAYRDVADALEQQHQLINEAEEYYAQTVLSAAGEQAIRLLSRPAGEPATRTAADTSGALSDWTLTDSLWKRLTDGTGDTELSGRIGSELMQASADAETKRTAAQSAADRFRSLLKVERAAPQLTYWHLYWQTIEDVLAARPLTIVDPKASNRQQLFLTPNGEMQKLLPSTPALSLPEEER